MKFSLNIKASEFDAFDFAGWVHAQECELKVEIQQGTEKVTIIIEPKSFYMGFAESVTSLIDFYNEEIVD